MLSPLYFLFGFFGATTLLITSGAQIWTYHTAIFQGGVLHSTVKKVRSPTS